MDVESAVRRAHRLDQMGKLALLAGIVLPIAVTVWLLVQGFGAHGELLFFGLWCCFGLFLLLKTASLWVLARSGPDDDAARRRARVKAWVYSVLSVVLVGGPLLFLLILLVGQAIS
jgi:hypothetical protein